MEDATPVLITEPSAVVITAADARTMLSLGASDPADALLEAMIAAVVGEFDAASNGWLGRALCPQTWELRLDEFPIDEIELPFPVLTSLTSVKYDDTGGVERTLVEGTDYRVFGLGGHYNARIEPAYNAVWPMARDEDESIRIRYVAGYAPAAMPPAIKFAVALGVKHLLSTSERNLYLSGEDIPGVRSRRWTVSEAAGKAIEATVGKLLSGYRVWG